MPRNKDSRIFTDADIDLGYFRIAVRARIRPVQKRHAGNSGFTGFQR